ncbi:aspartate dehydrogenase [bacterium]|nr:aspartate dehydrogenase [bacterium]MBU1782000.1 aspartate dehydrogenase [bacterium]
MKNIKVGVIGCGAIGSYICQNIKDISPLELKAIFDQEEEKAIKLSRCLPEPVKVLPGEVLIREVDLVIEAASQEAVKKYIKEALYLGKNVLIMSVGALVDDLKILEIAKEKNCQIYIPSGAIAGIDGLKSASVGKIKKVEINTTKSVKSLIDAPYVIKNKLNLKELTNKTRIFAGTALEAATSFPKNINVSAILSLAGIGFEKTLVNIYADPETNINTHEISIEGDFGKINLKCENLPSPFNPKTSFLAALSAVATLKQIVNPLKIGV